MDFQVNISSVYNITANIIDRKVFDVTITNEVYDYKVDLQSIVQVNYGHNKYLKSEFTYEDLADGFLSLGDARTNWEIYKVSLQISEAFGSGVLINIGDDDAQGRLMSESMNNPEEVANFIANPDYSYLATTELKIFFSGTSVTGAGKVIIYYA